MNLIPHTDKISKLFKNLFDVKRHISAKIFIVFIVVTFTIIILLTSIWYTNSTKQVYHTTVDGLMSSLSKANQQVDAIVEDIMRLHGSIIYGFDNVFSLLQNDFSPPTYDWFQEYKHTQELLKLMLTNLNRTISGSGIYKINGESCFTGCTMVQNSPFNSDWFPIVEKAEGHDVLLTNPYPFSPISYQVPYHISIARTVFDQGECIALLVTDINNSVLIDAFSSNIWDNGFVIILDDKGQTILDNTPSKYLDTKNFIKTALKNNRDSLGDINDFLIVTNKSPITQWTAIAAVPKSYIYPQINEIRYQLVSVLSISLVIIAIISIFISRNITSGLNILNRNIKHVSDGDLTGIIKLNSLDEVGNLNKVFIEMVEQIQHLMHDIEKRERHKRNMEIKVLRAQINPHFIYNTLNTIGYLAVMQNAGNIKVLTTSLIELLHGSIGLDDTLITLEDEIKYVKSYINIQQYRYASNITVEYQINQDLCHYKISRMILQPLVENSIIHGLNDIHKDGHIRIKATTVNEGSDLMLSVTDNGIGMTQQEIDNILIVDKNVSHKRFSGIGIKNVDERIKLQFGEKYGLRIYSQPNFFTTVEIHLPALKGDNFNA